MLSGRVRRTVVAGVLAILSGGNANAQVCRLGSAGYGYDARYDQEASDHALDIAKDVARVLCGGVCGVDLSRNPTAGNALTFVSGANAKIVYSPAFMTTVEDRFGESAIFGILAHEMGHVIDGRSR